MRAQASGLPVFHSEDFSLCSPSTHLSQGNLGFGCIKPRTEGCGCCPWFSSACGLASMVEGYLPSFQSHTHTFFSTSCQTCALKPLLIRMQHEAVLLDLCPPRAWGAVRNQSVKGREALESALEALRSHLSWCFLTLHNPEKVHQGSGERCLG